MRLQYLVTHLVTLSYQKLRFSYWRIQRKFRNSVTVSTKQGVFKVLLAEEEPIGQSLYCYGEYELNFMSNVMKFIRSIQDAPQKGEGTIVDIGANNGVISIGMLHTQELDKAIAIEPEPRNFSLLQHNILLNNLNGKVICLPNAVSNQKDQLQFEVSDTNFGDHRVRNFANSNTPELFDESGRRVITVQADQLDNLLASLPDSFTHSIRLIWVDVQGYEGFVFAGAKNTIAKNIPVVSEIWPYGIRRSGMTQEQFCEIAISLWAHYWVWRRKKFVRYPIHTLNIFFDELGYDGDFGNVIFTQ